jgi:hypothetical protein
MYATSEADNCQAAMSSGHRTLCDVNLRDPQIEQVAISVKDFPGSYRSETGGNKPQYQGRQK